MKTGKRKIKVLDVNDRIIEVEESGLPTLFQPHNWDIMEELENNEALREYRRELNENNY